MVGACHHWSGSFLFRDKRVDELPSIRSTFLLDSYSFHKICLGLRLHCLSIKLENPLDITETICGSPASRKSRSQSSRIHSHTLHKPVLSLSPHPLAPMTISDGPIPLISLLSPQLSAILSRIIGSRFTRAMSSIAKKGAIRIVIITHSYPDRTKKRVTALPPLVVYIFSTMMVLRTI